jgi:hypothetical protein
MEFSLVYQLEASVQLEEYSTVHFLGIAHLKPDGTRAETRFRLSPKRTSPFKSAGALVQSTAGSRVVRITGSNAGYTTFQGGVRVLATYSIRQFPLQFPSRASPCAIRFQTHYTFNVISHVKYFVLLHFHFPQYVCSAKYECIL